MDFPSAQSVWPVWDMIDPDWASKISNYQLYALGNGLRVFVMSDPNDRSTFAKIMVNAGALHQGVESRGIAHFTEHMLFQGTRMFPNQRAFLEHAEEFNLNWNGATTDSSQFFYVESDNDDESVREAMIHLSELLWRPLLPASKVEKEKEVVVSEREASLSNPDEFTREVINNHLYDQDTPWAGGGILGEVDQIHSFSHAQVVDFYKHYFHPANMVLVLVGGRDLQFYQDLIAEYFSSPLFGKEWVTNPVLDVLRQNQNREVIVPKDFNHVNVNIGYYLHRDAELKYPSVDLFALRFASYALSTRVYLDLRDERGLAYNVGASLDSFDIGYFFNISGEFPADKYQEARKAVEEYIDERMFEPVTEVEFRRALRYYKSIRWAKSGRHVAQHAADNIFYQGQPLAPESTARFMDMLDVDMVNQSVQKLLRGRQKDTVVVGKV